MAQRGLKYDRRATSGMPLGESGRPDLVYELGLSKRVAPRPDVLEGLIPLKETDTVGFYTLPIARGVGGGLASLLMRPFRAPK